MLVHSELVYVKKVKGKGRGVFARQPIPAGTVIENVPKILFPIDTIVDGFDSYYLAKYFFHHSETHVAFCLGYGSLYNHSYTPNADYWRAPGPMMVFKAIKDIAKDEEICVNYNGDPDSKNPPGFEVVE